MFQTRSDAQAWIENIKRFGSRLDLSRITKVLEKLGNPHLSFKTIHVGGTNGKGSTSNYLTNILMSAGYKVGLFTSPYVVDFNERIKINQINISDDNLIKYTNVLHDVSLEMQSEDEDNIVTFFEVLTAIAFLYYKDEAVDYAVVEVGLGGLLDATNVIVPEVSVITNVSYDHMKQLGDTLDSIAYNKLGIVKEGVPLVTGIHIPSLFYLIDETVANKHTYVKYCDFSMAKDIVLNETTQFSYLNHTYELSLPGKYQVNNAIIAIEAIKVLCELNQIRIDYKAIYHGLKITKWPGRFEIFNHQIILDGAHNIGGINALKDSVEAIYPNKRIICLFSVMKDKQHKLMIETLDSFCSELYFTEFDYSRRADAEDLYFESTLYKKSFHHDHQAIFKELSSHLEEDEILLVTGSLYFISEIRKLIVK